MKRPKAILGLALASLAQFVILLAVYSVGALAPLLREALHLSREQIGSLTALFFLGAIPASIPAGWPIGWACGAS